MTIPCKCDRLTANVMDGDKLLFAADVTPTDSVGDWMVAFTPTISGTYSLVLEFDGGRSLAGSPHRVRVKTDETVAGNCKLYGPGLTRAIAGEHTSFSIKGQTTVIVRYHQGIITPAVQAAVCSVDTPKEAQWELCRLCFVGSVTVQLLLF